MLNKEIDTYIILFLIVSCFVMSCIAVYLEHRYNTIVIEYNNCMYNLTQPAQFSGVINNDFKFETTS